MNQITRRQSAVTAACLLLRKSVFDTLQGLDEQAFPVAFNDVDLCLRIRQQGLSIIWTPFAELIHAESASRGKDQTPEKRARGQREQQGFIERWSQSGQSDPYYHPALSLDYLSGPYGGWRCRQGVKRLEITWREYIAIIRNTLMVRLHSRKSFDENCCCRYRLRGLIQRCTFGSAQQGCCAGYTSRKVERINQGLATIIDPEIENFLKRKNSTCWPPRLNTKRTTVPSS